jgi:hypothetical protein
VSDADTQTFAYQIRAPADGSIQCFLSLLSPDQTQIKRGLRPEAVLGQLKEPSVEIASDTFVQNPAFIRFLQWVVAKHASACPGLVAEAKRQDNGYVYVLDSRTPDPCGTVPPEDIIGAVEVRGGEMVQYTSSPNYRVVGSNGMMKLHPWFGSKVVEELMALPASDPPP